MHKRRNYLHHDQRRRHVWGMLDGGPGSAIHKSLDGGQTWAKLTEGLPKEDLGRIGLAIARGIVEAHGGRVWVESPGYDEALCPGSTFHVMLPVNAPTWQIPR